MSERVAHREQQPVGVERLLQEVERAALGRLHRGGDRAVPGDHDDLGAGIETAQPAQGLEAIEAGHLHVEEHELWAELRVQGDRLTTRRGYPHLQVLVLQDLLERLPNTRLVVHDENPMTHDREAP